MNELQAAVIEQLSGDESEARDTLRDVASYGADAGYGGFTCYSDTCGFFAANQSRIVDLVKEMADEFGQDPIGFVASFNCLADDRETRDEIGRCLYGEPSDEDTQVPNALAWFALEETARQLIDC